MEICFLTVYDFFKGKLIQSKLENEGIVCWIKTNDASGALPHLRNMQGIQIYISEKDLPRAQDVIKDFP